ncbi:hypothetical protein NDU88_010048 [Pleurodeles waltl]|uniref:Uncharacterized protein n=1 Tax=Pleurodeles waltl TaxID=8319 RepID=A0AAV7QZ65_PLEWA|nr:hypothetical protein NDU88_010048 [Pleurodeles waltl]
MWQLCRSCGSAGGILGNQPMGSGDGRRQSDFRCAVPGCAGWGGAPACLLVRIGWCRYRLRNSEWSVSWFGGFESLRICDF